MRIADSHYFGKVNLYPHYRQLSGALEAHSGKVESGSILR
jgi:hypothetical protein